MPDFHSFDAPKAFAFPLCLALYPSLWLGGTALWNHFLTLPISVYFTMVFMWVATVTACMG
jgi:hypothetical protein